MNHRKKFACMITVSVCFAIATSGPAQADDTKANVADERSLSSVQKSLKSREGPHAHVVDAEKAVSEDKKSIMSRQQQELKELAISPKELDDSTAPWELV